MQVLSAGVVAYEVDQRTQLGRRRRADCCQQLIQQVAVPFQNVDFALDGQFPPAVVILVLYAFGVVRNARDTG